MLSLDCSVLYYTVQPETRLKWIQIISFLQDPLQQLPDHFSLWQRSVQKSTGWKLNSYFIIADRAAFEDIQLA